MNRGWWLGALLLPAVAQAWEEEPALAFILAYKGSGDQWNRKPG